MPIGRLIIVCGLPGSGKTTYAQALAAGGSGVRFCPDEWMQMLDLDIWDEKRRAKIEALQWQQAQELLAAGVTVVIEWGTWGRSERDALRLGARAVGAQVELHYLSAAVDVLLERVRRRGVETRPITRADLSKWNDMFQKPTAEELALFDCGKVIEQR